MNPARAAALTLLAFAPLSAFSQNDPSGTRSRARDAFRELESREDSRPMQESDPSRVPVPPLGEPKEVPVPTPRPAAPGPEAPEAPAAAPQQAPAPEEPALANFVVDPNGLAAGLVVSRGAKGVIKVFLGGNAPSLRESLQQRGALSVSWNVQLCVRNSKIQNRALAREHFERQLLTTARELYLTDFALREHADQLSAPEARAAVERYRDRARKAAERINSDCASSDFPGPVIPLREQPRD